LILWIDAQLSPRLIPWLNENFDVESKAVRDVGLRDANDYDIFLAARDAGAVVMTKDSDFLRLLEQHGPPPQILWITCGNTSNAYLRELLGRTLPPTLRLLDQGESLVEISDSM
jgi:predicted nuclease of predicted toxin-antitoxin system